MSEQKPRVSPVEVKELLRRVGNGDAVPRILEYESWHNAYAGDVPFDVAGWRVVVFNDCDDFDYIDSVRSPDGREADYDDFQREDENGRLQNPEGMLYHEDQACYERMIRAFVDAKPATTTHET